MTSGKIKRLLNKMCNVFEWNMVMTYRFPSCLKIRLNMLIKKVYLVNLSKRGRFIT